MARLIDCLFGLVAEDIIYIEDAMAIQVSSLPSMAKELLVEASSAGVSVALGAAFTPLAGSSPAATQAGSPVSV